MGDLELKQAVPIPAGRASLVGAGPGDPGLLTLKARACLERADVVIYDRLVSPAVLAAAPPGCELIDAGKQSGFHRLDQAAINALLVERARAGQRVVRLKGGDPFIFGRGGEEALALAAAGLPFEIVPGISSVIAAPAYAGIPLTHRGIASSFQVINGHDEDLEAITPPALDRGGQDRQTLVIVMGIERLELIVQRLVDQGRPATTPVAVVRWGTRPDQQTVVGTLADIVPRVTAAGLVAPAVIVVGEVVRLRERLSWFDSRPLAGRQVLVARSRLQSSRLAELFTAQGAQVFELPVMQEAAVEDDQLVDAALGRLADYDWVLLTSQTAVTHVFARLRRLGRDARAFGRCQIAAAGPGTAQALATVGIMADLAVDGAVVARLVTPLAERGLHGRRVLVLRSELPHAELQAGLAAQGALVDEAIVYRMMPTTDPRALQAVRTGQIDAVALAGSGATHNLLAALSSDLTGLEGAAVVAIGPRVAATARQGGLRVQALAPEPSLTALVATVQATLGAGALVGDGR